MFVFIVATVANSENQIFKSSLNEKFIISNYQYGIECDIYTVDINIL